MGWLVGAVPVLRQVLIFGCGTPRAPAMGVVGLPHVTISGDSTTPIA